MISTNKHSTEATASSPTEDKKDQVDKGTTRTTPGSSEGAKPPSKEDFRKIQRENDRENDPQEEIVDNEERDKNR